MSKFCSVVLRQKGPSAFKLWLTSRVSRKKKKELDKFDEFPSATTFPFDLDTDRLVLPLDV